MVHLAIVAIQAIEAVVIAWLARRHIRSDSDRQGFEYQVREKFDLPGAMFPTTRANRGNGRR